MVLGRIERVDSEWIIVDGRSRDRKGERYGLTLAVDDVLGFNFEDARYIPADQPEAAKKAEMYDGFLFFQLEWCMCSIWAIKLPDELP
jgi:hypothetical protein